MGLYFVICMYTSLYQGSVYGRPTFFKHVQSTEYRVHVMSYQYYMYKVTKHKAMYNSDLICVIIHFKYFT